MAVTQDYLDEKIQALDVPMAHEIGLEIAHACHRKAGVHARYFSGVLWLTCARCGKDLLDVHLATRKEMQQRTYNAFPSA